MTGTAKRIVANFDLDPLVWQFLEVHHLLGSGDVAAAGALIEQLRGTVSPTRVRDQVELHTLDANWRSLNGDTAGAIRCVMAAINAGIDGGMPGAELARLEIFAAICFSWANDFGAADLWSERAQADAYGHDRVLAKEARQFVQAYRDLMNNESCRAGALLCEALGSHRRRQSTTLFVTVPSFAGAVAAHALAVGIEVDHVREIIVRQRLTPPERFAPNWPWPVAVYTLGKLDLALNGDIVSPSGKAQQRPLLLLKALLAAGDAGKTQQSLASHLWPDADDAKSALNVTIHRLRKMLGLDEAVIVGAGKVVLSKALVWSDVAALSDLCDRIDSLPGNASAVVVNRHASSMLALYRGPFCDGEDDTWLLSARDCWRNRFLTAASALGQHLERNQEWSQARHIYLRSLETEPLAEVSYRGLMRCEHALGDPTAAFSAYRRCRETLSILIGHQPSPETEKLVVQLGLK